MGIPDEYMYDFWQKENIEQVQLTCLLPNSLVIIIDATNNSCFADIREDLWYEAQRLPLFGALHNVSKYRFTYINDRGENEEIVDESMRLEEVRPMGALLMISEVQEGHTEDKLNLKIGQLIGKRLDEFDALSSPEINDFRFQTRQLADSMSHSREQKTWTERLLYQYPERISTTALNLDNVKNSVYISKNIYLLGRIDGHSEHNFKICVSANTDTGGVLEMLLKRKSSFLKTSEKPSDYVLKVLGADEYLISDHPIVNFEYIRDCISKDEIPKLVLISKANVIMHNNDYQYTYFNNTKKPPYSTLTLRKKSNFKSSWNIDKKFELTVQTACKVNCDVKVSASMEIGIMVGIFHGGKSLCQPQHTKHQLLNENMEFTFNERLVFNIDVCNLPRSAKLCLAIYEVPKSGKGTKNRKTKEPNKEFNSNPVAWANTTIFDYRNQLKTGAMTLYLWTYAEDAMMLNDDLLYPLGTVVSNPGNNATSLTITFDSSCVNVYFPSLEQMINKVEERYEREEREEREEMEATGDYEDVRKIKEMSESELSEFKKTFIENDIYEVHDQERKEMWRYRSYWLEREPEVLPKLLHCIDWDNQEDVGDMVHMLQRWPVLPVEKALELLDYAYADQQVRGFAVRCLLDIVDDDLLLYLLQLVQALKHELFLYCDLVTYLLQRALCNQKIGHYLFWHLRSEMQVASVSVRFGLILEAYCRGSCQHMPALSRQLEGLEKLKKISEVVRKSRRDKEKARVAMQDYMTQHSKDSFKDFISPLDPSNRCNSVRVDKVKVMDSKMRPLWIVFENSDTMADDIYIIFKNGDDLRQDMLTLQMLRVMDKLWKEEGLDFRMNPYKCISTEYRIGMIEVVLNAETIANIQKERVMFSATSPFRKESLLDWLKYHNKTEAALKQAIYEFTLSCAGYCVATYVLGVADRHSDNIMVKKNGQLFHIDFGHILGHFKEKFGFKRERVPFVLTHDFVHVISKGEKKNLEFKMFQQYCEQAFLILRKHGGLILSLFAMMISTGLPELSSEKDLNYLKETLVLSKSEEEALQHFRSKFDEALSNSWKTSMNWATHNISKNNKVY
ncbi:PREDICTED: phosphatidylinositol 4,5-bisphosphate 3-kinase catalytic subunit delta isoform [Nicrophorus vespilloides]|uniref:Phosphatidylinositol 4,5-bisphosphate 3-kinase catalytic subunit delta isoform n=1 Tax=Nicrophorus vespilloides TaxID=110193 RepID=A0ABM1MZ59_NICVS|nr:PREDICTED: phosphatidylinositol 4,5-bisphosphate 3-kinase catalytic subunit delta isoform [Nicrophorus vespilloides]XP_017779859.1 PREDICTED: phosphatidylinositol 4,5-bisphosphate 3-kinase catalytic subunit delta isoform [Nicrophorus vespilloides]XP_017779860.1 PREDICTED: phosphatidylinositol 4,5-bisphosphate 3-kinase catalytic subunit delta isoform [Nicrophorus vespilloides]